MILFLKRASFRASLRSSGSASASSSRASIRASPTGTVSLMLCRVRVEPSLHQTSGPACAPPPSALSTMPSLVSASAPAPAVSLPTVPKFLRQSPLRPGPAPSNSRAPSCSSRRALSSSAISWLRRLRLSSRAASRSSCRPACSASSRSSSLCRRSPWLDSSFQADSNSSRSRLTASSFSCSCCREWRSSRALARTSWSCCSMTSRSLPAAPPGGAAGAAALSAAFRS
mmetsp:Transcript_67032/g.196026  ORF Transcript_67032/g.196026 Transcript_67032/m.196026 type:complete len:228 (+) Transcript_67032:1208-1891(+)